MRTAAQPGAVPGSRCPAPAATGATTAGEDTAAQRQSGRGSELNEVLLQHGRHGLRAQHLLVALLTALAVAVALTVPVRGAQVVCAFVAAGYLLRVCLTARAARHPAARLVRWAWTGLLVDLLATTTLVVAARWAGPHPWAPTTLLAVLFLLPALAAFQLRPVVCGVVGALATLTHLILRLADQPTTGSTAALLAPTAVLAGLALTCALLCELHRSQVSALFHLAADAARRADEEVDIERRERQVLAEHLGTEVLQPLRAARHDLGLASDEVGTGALHRSAETLRSVTAVLASALVALDPVLLRRAGLPAALHQLVTALPLPPGQVVRLRTDGWPDDLRTPVDPVLYGAAREMVVGVLEHGRSTVVEIELGVVDGTAVLQVHDDGAGAAVHLLAARAAEPPLGLASRRSRLEAAGGELHLQTGDDGCTVARATLPLPLG